MGLFEEPCHRASAQRGSQSAMPIRAGYRRMVLSRSLLKKKQHHHDLAMVLAIVAASSRMFYCSLAQRLQLLSSSSAAGSLLWEYASALAVLFESYEIIRC